MIDGLGERTKHGQVYRARHAGQAPEIDGVTYVLSSEPLKIGDFYRVQVEKRVGDYDLIAVPYAAPAKKEKSLRAARSRR